MRRIPVRTLVAAMTGAIALGSASVALGNGATDNVAQGVASINPNLQSATKFGGASLFTQVTSLDENNNPYIPAESAEKVWVDFDDSGKITTVDLPKCDKADLEATTVQQALNACGDALVGAGSAIARIPGVPDPVEIELTVTDFNGKTSVAGPGGCPAGGFPTILLHARNDGVGLTVVVEGVIRPSPNASGDYGKRLEVCDAPDVAGDLGALVLFNSQARRQYKDSAGKIKNYITARCDDANKIWNVAYRWQYDDGSVDTDTSTQQCGN